MGWKTIFTTLLVGLIVISLALAYVFVSAKRIDLLEERVKSVLQEVTGRELNINGNLKLTLALKPKVVAEEVTLSNARWGSRSELLKIARIESSFEIIPLLFGKLVLDRLALIGTDLWLETNHEGHGNWQFHPKTETSRSAQDTNLRLPILHKVLLKNLNVYYLDKQTNKVNEINVHRLSADARIPDQSISLEYAGSINQHSFEGSGRAGSLSHFLLSKNDFPIELTFNVDESQLKINGVIGEPASFSDIDLSLEISGADLVTFLPLESITLPPMHHYSINGKLRGSIGEISNQGVVVGAKHDLSLQDLSVEFVMQDLTLHASGNISDVLSLNFIELEIQLLGKNIAALGKLLDTELPHSEGYKITGKYIGSPKTAAFENLEAETSGYGATWRFFGKIGNLLTLSEIDLKLDVTGQNIAELNELFDITLPETKHYSIKGQLMGAIEAVSLQNIIAEVDEKNGIKFAASGTIDNLIRLADIDLNVTSSGRNLTYLGDIIGKTLPVTDKFYGSARLRSNPDGLSLHGIDARLKAKQTRASIRGKIASLNTLTGIDLALNTSGQNLADLNAIIATELPDTGNFRINGLLRGSEKRLSLQKMDLEIMTRGLEIRLAGRINDITKVSGIDAQLNISGTDSDELGRLLETKLPSADSFSVNGHILGSHNRLSSDDLIVSITNNATRLTLRGKIANLNRLSGMDLKLQVGGEELANLDQMVGFSLPAVGKFRGSARVRGSPTQLYLDGINANFARSNLKGSIVLRRDRRLKILARSHGGTLDVTPFMEAVDSATKSTTRGKASNDSVFSTQPIGLRKLGNLDIQLTLDSDRILALNGMIEISHAKIHLTGGHLIIDPLKLKYGETTVSGRLSVVDGEAPLVSTKLLTQNFNLGKFLTEIGKTDKFEGNIDIALNLLGQGETLKELMTNLNGTASLVMSDGRITQRGIAFAVFTGDLRKKLMPWEKNPDTTTIDCGLLQFKLNSGLAESQAMLFDLDNALVSGTGNLDLRSETLDFTLLARRKHATFLATIPRVNVKGPLRNPAIQADTRSIRKNLLKGTAFLPVLGPLSIVVPFTTLGATVPSACVDKLQKIFNDHTQ